MPKLFQNPLYRQAFAASAPGNGPARFHRRLPGYAPTPLWPLPRLARRIGVASVQGKFEGQRFGLPAYKVLGASWATFRVLEERAGGSLPEWESLDGLRAHLAPLGQLRLITASDGNHGRAVARVAQMLGYRSRIYLPAGTVPARLEAIAGEGGEVVVVEGTYDETVARAAAEAGPDDLLIQDHGWPGYEAIPALISDGYSTLFGEIDQTLTAAGDAGPGLVVVPIGVGTLAAAAVQHYRGGNGKRVELLGVEPVAAACALESAAAGAPVNLDARAGSSIMAGLVCGTPSSAAWPLVSAGFRHFAAIEDRYAVLAMQALASEGVRAGESGAAGVGALLALLEGEDANAKREQLGLSSRSRVVVLVTEGITDPAAWGRLVGDQSSAMIR